MKIKFLGTLSGLAVFTAILLFADLDPENRAITTMAAVAALMAVWWVTEAIPISATALVPLILFPTFGIISGNETAASYINSTIFLFLGGFLIAIAMEKWELHKRMALRIVLFFGGSPNSIVVGFMAASAFLSMWISNTATAVMMLPIALSIMRKLEEDFGVERTKNFSKTLMLGIAYACSIGGIATIIGTPPNLSMVRIYSILFPQAEEISFGSWLILALPISIILLILAAFLLLFVFFRFDKTMLLQKDFMKNEYASLGRIRYEEKIVAVIFSVTAFLWIFRTDLNLGIILIPGWERIFAYSAFINDGTVAVGMALLLFIIPAKKEEYSKGLLDASAFKKVPWGIIILFGGGFALAAGFTATGLSDFIGVSLRGLSAVSPFIIILVTAAVINFLSELTSNTATAEMILPVMASLAIAINLHPLLLMITAALSASMAFMLPAATPPNTIVFASERLRIPDMVKAGFTLNISSIIIISLFVYLLGSIIFDFQTFP
jgi:solute carrier family 13 (sodium-dependent dicarboxylate transporter), member 2/3/5